MLFDESDTPSLLQDGLYKVAMCIAVSVVYMTSALRPMLSIFRVMPDLGIFVRPSSTPGARTSEFLDWLHAGPLIINEVLGLPDAFNRWQECQFLTAGPVECFC
jgi:hypothetical protein